MGEIVFTNGCFDVLHVGHINLIHYCRQLAGENGKVIVAIDSDEKIKKDKGANRPIFTEVERSKTLVNLYSNKPLIDLVCSFNTNENLYKIIKSVKPTIIVKGMEWKDNVIGSDLAQVMYYTLEGYSSTKIIDRILKKHE